MLRAFYSDRKEDRGEENQKEQAGRDKSRPSFWHWYSTIRHVETRILHVSLLYYLYNFTKQYYYQSGRRAFCVDKKWPRPNKLLGEKPGGLIENMILRKTRALALAPGLPLEMMNLLNSITAALYTVQAGNSIFFAFEISGCFTTKELFLACWKNMNEVHRAKVDHASIDE